MELNRKPNFTKLGDCNDGLREKEALIKGIVQVRRYIGDLARVSLEKEGQVTLKAIWFRVPGCFNLAKASSLDSGVLVFVDKSPRDNQGAKINRHGS